MKNSIAAGGPVRFAMSKEYRVRRRELQMTVAAKYAAEFAKAGFFRRLFIRYLRHREFQRELRKITPSLESCWLGVMGGYRTQSSQNEKRKYQK